MTDNLRELPPPEKKVAAKELILNGYSLRQVEGILGIDKDTASRYANQETPEDLRQFETIFKNYIQEQKQKGIDIVYKRLLELLPRERRIDQVVKAGEYLEGKNNPQTLQQFNVGGNMELEFIDNESKVT